MTRGDDTRQTILEEAMRQASVGGLDGLSIGSLASDLDMSKSGLFAHFRSKENLQLAVLKHGAQDFLEYVMRPALDEPRGEPRVRMLVDRWLSWSHEGGPPGGCVFVTASVEFDDRPGVIHDEVQSQQNAWIDFVTRACEIAVEEGHFRSDLDCRQLAFEINGILLGSQHFGRLLGDPDVLSRTRVAIDRLLRAAAT